MTSLVRLSRSALMKFSRTSATTSTPSGGARVQPSGVSKNLSEASRAADGADMALRDAAQGAKKTSATNQQTNTPKSEGSGPYAKVGLGLVVAFVTYYVYKMYIRTPDSSKSLNYNNENKKQDSRAHSADRDVSSGKKH